jgi:hypothetical protein
LFGGCYLHIIKSKEIVPQLNPQFFWNI